MRSSPKKHTLAVLRLRLGLGQKEMAALIGCAAVTVQKIELGDRPLKVDLARQIAEQTGVDQVWLMQDDPLAPIITRQKAPYTTEAFQARQKKIKQAAKPAMHKVQAAALSTVGLVLSILASAYKQKRFFECVSALAGELGRLQERFGTNAKISETVRQVSESQTTPQSKYLPIATAFHAALKEL